MSIDTNPSALKDCSISSLPAQKDIQTTFIIKNLSVVYPRDPGSNLS
jgi:hypothetical protein